MKRIGATPATLSRSMGCDRSNVSRLCKGQRVPKREGVGARRLVTGICLYADEQNKMKELCACISCVNAGSFAEVEARTSSWLFEGVDESEKDAAKRKKKEQSYRTFGQRFSALMDLTDLGNNRLGRLLNVDPSYISRFRKGLRSPRSNQKTMDAICEVLLERLREQKKMKQLANMMQISPEAMANDEEVLPLLKKWLFFIDSDEHTPGIEWLMDRFVAFSDGFDLSVNMPDASDLSGIDLTRKVYFGKKGLQDAALRLLHRVLQTDGGKLYLYSEQNLSWMISDREYLKKWLGLMLACIRKGVKILVIHNTDRDSTEMFEAINSWLPLYYTGQISSYYCKKTRSTRFTGTLFLCPGCASIAGFNVIGCENERGYYRFDEDKTILDAQMHVFEDLLKDSEKLIQVYKTPEIYRLMPDINSDFTVFCNTPTLETMTEELLEKILSRINEPEPVKENLRQIYQKRRKLTFENIDRFYMHECLPAASREALEQQRVPIDLPGLQYAYTPGEYAEHTKNLIALSDRLQNFRLFILPEAPIANLRLLISKDAVSVSRMLPPYITFYFTHPLMCAAFIEYAAKIKERCASDKLTTKKMLEKLL